LVESYGGDTVGYIEEDKVIRHKLLLGNSRYCEK